MEHVLWVMVLIFNSTVMSKELTLLAHRSSPPVTLGESLLLTLAMKSRKSSNLSSANAEG